MQTIRPRHGLGFSAVYLFTLVTFLAGQSSSWLDVGAAAVLAFPLIWLSMTDLSKMTIPDGASAFVLVIGFLHQIHQDILGLITTLPIAILLFLLLWLAGEAYWRKAGHEALGIGDAKLIAAGTICVGAENIWLVVLLASIGGIIAILVARTSGNAYRSAVPFGPFLAYAIYIIFLSTGSP